MRAKSKNRRCGNDKMQECILPRATLGFCSTPCNPLLKRHCGDGNKLVCCHKPHLFSQQLTAQSCVCSQIEHGQKLIPQFRTPDCLVKRATHARRTKTHTAVPCDGLLGGVPLARCFFGALLVFCAYGASGKLQFSATHAQCGYHHAVISSEPCEDIIVKGNIVSQLTVRSAI